jgi:hypothetical protein
MKFFKRKQHPLPANLKLKSPISLQLLVEATRNYFDPNLTELSPREIVDLSKENLKPALDESGYSLEMVIEEVKHMQWRHIDVALSLTHSSIYLCHRSEPDTLLHTSQSTNEMFIFLKGVNCGVDANGNTAVIGKYSLKEDEVYTTFEYCIGSYKGTPSMIKSGPYSKAQADLWKLGYQQGTALYHRRLLYLKKNKKTPN